jgi:hypothetical protein
MPSNLLSIVPNVRILAVAREQRHVESSVMHRIPKHTRNTLAKVKP